MVLTLSEKWSLGIAFGEFTSSALLIFFVMVVALLSKKKLKNNKSFLTPITSSFLFGLLGAIAIFVGIGVGNLISGNKNTTGNQGLGLMSPNFALITSIHWNTFGALPMIVGFQFIGSIFGLLLYLLFTKMIIMYRVGNFKYEDGLIIDNSDHTKFSLKSFLSQMFYVVFLVFIAFLNEPPGLVGIMGFSLVNNTILLSIGLVILFVLFSRMGYFMLSPFVVLPSLVLSYISGNRDKKIWVNFLIETTIQFSYIGLFSGIDNYVRYYK